MHLTRGERVCLICYALVLIGFLPPVIIWANHAPWTVLGLPFLLFWTSVMVIATSISMTVAFAVKKRIDRQ